MPVTESSIFDEPVAAAVQYGSIGGGDAVGKRGKSVRGPPPAASSFASYLHAGGGGMSANPVRLGWLSVRLAIMPSADAAEAAPPVAVIAAPGAAAAAPSARAPAASRNVSLSQAYVGKRGDGPSPLRSPAAAAAAASRRGAGSAYSPYGEDEGGGGEGGAAMQRQPSASARLRLAAGVSLKDDSTSSSSLSSDAEDDEEEDATDSDDDSYLARVGGASGKRPAAAAAASARRAQLKQQQRRSAAVHAATIAPSLSSSSVEATVPHASVDAAEVSLRVRAAVRPLVVVWSPSYMRRLITWLTIADCIDEGSGEGAPPPPFLANTKRVGALAGALISQLLNDASRAIEAAMHSGRSRVDVRAFLAAPVLIVPQRVTATPAERRAMGLTPHASPALILDLGCITVASRWQQAPVARAAASSAASPSSSGGGSSPAQPLPILSVLEGVRGGAPGLFDQFVFDAAGMTAVLCARAIVEDTEEFDSRLHDKLQGVGPVAMMQGLTDDDDDDAVGATAAAVAAAAAAEEAESATRDRLSSSFSLTARRVAAAGGTGALVEAQRNPWNLAALGPPRVAWYRASIRPLLRHCAVHAEVNVLSEDGEGGSGGGRGVRAALRSPPLSAGTAAASAAAAPPSPALWHTTPAVFVRVHADQLSLSLSTGDVVDLANIVLAASVPFAERELQQRQQLLLLRQRQQQAAIERGVGAAASNLAAEVAEEPPASAHRRLFGIRALLFKPFDKLSHSWYGMTDLAAHMPPPEQLLADAAASSGVSRSASSSSSSSSMVGARGAASKQDAQRPQLLPAPARPAW